MTRITKASELNATSVADAPPRPREYAPDELGQLDVNGLLRLLVADEDRAPRTLIDECARRGEMMVEALRCVIDEGRAWNEDAEAGEWWLMLHAAMVLGLIPGESAGDLLVRLMRRMAVEEDDNIQDWLAGHWPALFENKPPTAVEAVRRLSEDRTVDWYIRHQGIEVVANAALRSGAQALEACLDWLAAIASEKSEEWDMRISAASVLLDFPRERHRALLDTIAEEEARLAEKESPFGIPRFTLADVNSAFAKERDEPDWKRDDEPWQFYSAEAIAQRQERWAKEDAKSADEEDFDDLPLPYVRETPKIGRNDPCPCGSGKKYKKCCLVNEAA